MEDDSFKKKPEEEIESKMPLILRAQEEKRAQIKAASFNLPYVNLLMVPIEVDALSKVPEPKARAGLFIPFEMKIRKIAIAAFDPQNDILNQVIQDLKSKDYEVELFVCSVSSLKRGFREYQRVRGLQKEVTKEIEISAEEIGEIKKEIKQFFHRSLF